MCSFSDFLQVILRDAVIFNHHFLRMRAAIQVSVQTVYVLYFETTPVIRSEKSL
jgi:hypothetical protein